MNTGTRNILRQQNILIAGNDKEDINVITDILTRKGCLIQRAFNGKDALQCCLDNALDLAVLDADLSIFDALDVASKIKDSSKRGRYIPVILLADKADQIMFFEMAASGIDDIQIRPMDMHLLTIKIELLSSLQAEINTIKSSYDALFSVYTKLQFEYDAAERLFTKLTPFAEPKLRNIKYHMSPQSLSNGDILLCEESSGGDQYFFIGDFTGHGLAAAMGACSIREIFCELARQQKKLAEIIEILNDVLVNVLPPELFAAACFLHYKKKQNSAEIWNGGIPPVHVYNNISNRHEEIVSCHSPLGIEKYKAEHLIPQTISVEDGARILIASDGLIEARDKSDKMFGMERVKDCIVENMKSDDVYERLYTALLQHRAGKVQADDVTLIEILY